MIQDLRASTPLPVKHMYRRIRAAMGADIHADIGRIALRHLARYEKADPLVAGRKLLDVACGSGYGAMVMPSASSYLGVDLDPRALRAARREYPEFEFRQSSIYELPFSSATFGAVTSFETLEHVDNPEKAVSEVARVLESGGLLVGSIPINHPDRIYHFRPYSASEAFDIFTSDPSLIVRTLDVQRDLSFETVQRDNVGDILSGTLYAVLEKQ